jgi:hypothetical protein
LIARLRGFIVALWLVFSTPVAADIDDSSYDTHSESVSAAARQAMDARLAQERQREEERERREREAEAREEAARQAALAARPYPVRLLEQRCTACHASTHYMEQSHTLPGWWFVVVRMKYLNGAELAPAEMPILAAHLSEIRGAAGLEAALEYAALPTLLALPWVTAVLWRRRGRRHRQHGVATP